VKRVDLNDATATLTALREWMLLGSLNHPNIIRLVRARADGTGLVTFFLERGEPLPENFPVAEIKRLVRDLARGLFYLHDLGFAHCDVKPANVVEVEGVYKLIDFGGCVNIAGKGLPASWTWVYVPPEMFEDEQIHWAGVTNWEAFDGWSLGMLLLNLLGGTHDIYESLMLADHQRALHALDLRQDLYKRLKQVPRLSADFRVLLARLLCPKPKRRTTPRHILSALQKLPERQNRLMRREIVPRSLARRCLTIHRLTERVALYAVGHQITPDQVAGLVIEALAIMDYFPNPCDNELAFFLSLALFRVSDWIAYFETMPEETRRRLLERAFQGLAENPAVLAPHMLRRFFPTYHAIPPHQRQGVYRGLLATMGRVDYLPEQTAWTVETLLAPLPEVLAPEAIGPTFAYRLMELFPDIPAPDRRQPREERRVQFNREGRINKIAVLELIPPQRPTRVVESGGCCAIQ
jgi:hypothetical protein